MFESMTGDGGMEEMKRICLTVNGNELELMTPVRYSLTDCLRELLDLTGTHLGCEHGYCGACNVLVDGQSTRSCLMLAVQADGCKIMTIEGLAEDGELSPLQNAFHEHHGLQCGFCTPGFLITATELFSENLTPTNNEIKEAMSGNICRCTGYKGIMDALESISKSNINVSDV
jgi:carbon-monoxide dehydrogenase small subunit